MNSPFFETLNAYVDGFSASLLALGGLLVCIFTRRMRNVREFVWAVRLVPLVLSFTLCLTGWWFLGALCGGMLVYMAAVCRLRWTCRTPGSAVRWTLGTAGRSVFFALPVLVFPVLARVVVYLFVLGCYEIVTACWLIAVCSGSPCETTTRTPAEVRTASSWRMSEITETVPFSVGFLCNNESQSSYDRKVVFKSGKFFGIDAVEGGAVTLSVYRLTADAYALEDEPWRMTVVNVADETVCAWRLNKWIRMPENMYLCGFNSELDAMMVSPDLQNPQAEERPSEVVPASLSHEEMVGLYRMHLLGTIDARGRFTAAR